MWCELRQQTLQPQTLQMARSQRLHRQAHKHMSSSSRRRLPTTGSYSICHISWEAPSLSCAALTACALAAVPRCRGNRAGARGARGARRATPQQKTLQNLGAGEELRGGGGDIPAQDLPSQQLGRNLTGGVLEDHFPFKATPCQVPW